MTSHPNPDLDKIFTRLYRGDMKTITITDAKKNLGVLLKAAARGEDMAIVSGADVIALRKVEVEAVDYTYAMREHGATPEQLDRFEQAVDRRYEKMEREGKLMTLEQTEELLEKTHSHRRRGLRAA